MKIVVLGGSPKGMNSVTMHYVAFLQKEFAEHDFTIHSVCHDIKKLDERDDSFREVIDGVAAADIVLWAFPVYYFSIHANYKRFIELLFERQVEASFKGKYAAILTTSIRFFDHTAHEYVHGICDDLGMKCLGVYSAAMYDLLETKEQDRLLLFAKGLFRAVERKDHVSMRYEPIASSEFVYKPGRFAGAHKTEGKRVVIVTDCQNLGGNLSKMVQRLRGAFQTPPNVVNLREIRIRGGCIGCIQCGIDNQCVYRDSDDIQAVYDQLMAADILVLAGSVQDRYLSSRWKLFFDRGFFNGHVPLFVGKQMGYLVSGPLKQLANLRQILESYAACEQANLIGTVTDECGDSGELDDQLDDFAGRLLDCATAGYMQPPNFLATGGQKVFRDEIWSNLRLVFQADHRYYRAHGLYDFPTRSLKARLGGGMFLLLLKIPGFRREFRKRIKNEMVKPLTKVVEGGSQIQAMQRAIAREGGRASSRYRS